MKNLRVELGHRSYHAICGHGAIEELPRHLVAGDVNPKPVVITDESVGSLWGARLEALLVSSDAVWLVVPAGEPSKSFARAEVLLEQMSDAGITRDDVVVAFGGGMVGDLAGFVASIYHRGMRVVHVPTTLLAQVDSSIGGKTGVNVGPAKNLAGTFHQPWMVISDPGLLDTLSDRQFRSGVAEVIKYRLCFEGEVQAVLSEQMQGLLRRDINAIERVVQACVACKASVVSEDETDRGRRAVLNYGHTFGHALEAFGDYERWLHGEAISVGMRFAGIVAHASGFLDKAGTDLHDELLRDAGLPLTASFDRGVIESILTRDKKNRRGPLGTEWVLLEGIGRPVLHAGLPQQAFDRAFEAVAE